MNQARHRVGQFFLYLRAQPTPEDEASVKAVLPPALLALFHRQSPGEQKHSLKVMRWLADKAPHQTELLQAALLHDVGKSLAPINLVERVEAVLVRWLLPGPYARWAEAPPRGWRKPFVTAVKHPAWGADLAAQAGAPPLVVNLIRRHQDPEGAPVVTEEDRLLELLQQAESQP
jgi:putative nucleotidyltransferase with HDIG domain